MVEIFSELNGEELVMLVFIVAATIVSLAVVTAVSLQKRRDRELSVVFIQDMLDQGMSVDQIGCVLTAAGFKGGGR